MAEKKPLIDLPEFPVWAQTDTTEKDHLMKPYIEQGCYSESLCGTVVGSVVGLLQPTGDRCKNCERIARRIAERKPK